MASNNDGGAPPPNPLAALFSGGMEGNSLTKEQERALLQQLLSSFGGSVVVEDSEQKDAAENAVPKKVAKWSNAGEGDYNAETIVCYNCNCMVLRPENGVFCAAEVAVPSMSGEQLGSEAGTGSASTAVGGMAFSAETLKSFWKVKNVFTFENIAACKDVPGDRFKYYGCAECERGPIALQLLRPLEAVQGEEEKEKALRGEAALSADGSIYVCAERVKYVE